jgi:Predicted dehydrogenases and related proteins
MSSTQPNNVAQRPVQVLVVGAGARGEIYSRYALAHPDLMQVVAVAEPRDAYREQFVAQHAIASENVFTDWRQAADAGKLADAVLICTQDQMHLEPALAFAARATPCCWKSRCRRTPTSAAPSSPRWCAKS